MSLPAKIVLIGAGSAVFTQGLLADFILSTDFRPLEIALVDTDEQVLHAIAAVARRMVSVKQAEITITASTDRKDVLPGADVVVTTIAVGGRRAWEADVFIPRKYGIYQPVGDTTMPGGISRALRMIPVMLEIARDVQALCPDAYFFNYSNPMTAICMALRKEAQVDVIGLCHGVLHVEHHLAHFLGVEPSQVRSLGVGLNHLTFLHDLRVGGENGWTQVDEVLQDQKRYLQKAENAPDLFAEMGQAGTANPTYHDNLFSWELYETYGAFPAVLDRHVVEFFPERFRDGRYYGRTLGVDAFSFENVIAKGDAEYEILFQRATGAAELDNGLFSRQAGEHEQLVDILRSLYLDERRTFSVNLENQGAIPNLPKRAVLELPAVATGRGFYPLFMHDFPDALLPILNRRIHVVELTVEAALTGRHHLFVEALLADGSVTSEAMAQQLATELLEVHRDYLPQFA